VGGFSAECGFSSPEVSGIDADACDVSGVPASADVVPEDASLVMARIWDAMDWSAAEDESAALSMDAVDLTADNSTVSDAFGACGCTDDAGSAMLEGSVDPHGSIAVGCPTTEGSVVLGFAVSAAGFEEAECSAGTSR